MPHLQKFVCIRRPIHREMLYCNSSGLICCRLYNVENSVNLIYGLKLASVLFAHLVVSFVVRQVVRSSKPRREKLLLEGN